MRLPRPLPYKSPLCMHTRKKIELVFFCMHRGTDLALPYPRVSDQVRRSRNLGERAQRAGNEGRGKRYRPLVHRHQYVIRPAVHDDRVCLVAGDGSG
jgi:hypothetical protein